MSKYPGNLVMEEIIDNWLKGTILSEMFDGIFKSLCRLKHMLQGTL